MKVSCTWLLFLAFSLSFIQNASAQITAFALTSSPTSRVGAGRNEVFTEETGFGFLGAQDFGSVAEIRVTGDVYGSWIMNFASPGSGAHAGDSSFPMPGRPPLEIGHYATATRYPFHDIMQPGSAGLSFVGQGRGVNTLNGSFTIYEFVTGPDRTLQSFAADFIQYDEGAIDQWNKGRIRFHSTIPLFVPEPSFASAAFVLGIAACLLNRLRAPLASCQ